MEYAASDLTPRERYKVLTSFVLPRPIAWVTSVGPSGIVNAAPFSFFNVFCEDPPLCMFAANRKPNGQDKDTFLNIQRTGEFVVNIADERLAKAMHESSGDFPPDIGEPDYLGLKLAPSRKVARFTWARKRSIFWLSAIQKRSRETVETGGAGSRWKAVGTGSLLKATAPEKSRAVRKSDGFIAE